MDVGRPAQREVDGPGRHGRVVLPVDEDEAAQRPVLYVWRERDRLGEREVAEGHFVQADLAGGKFGLRVDIDAMLDLGDAGCHRAGADLEPITPTRQQGFVVHPQQVYGELVGDFRRISGAGDDVPA